mmetsp:Transcript_51196/g.57997  ORF Transcript_51196/g.57997 Transcript_51196/m.57997 type:complete len:218 (+) Transcript_51196:170-823(+)
MTNPSTPPKESESVAPKPSPDRCTAREDLLVDPPGYIAPEQQDMMLLDITSAVLHRETHAIGCGKEYLSPVDHFPLSWPAAGVIFGLNQRLMINLPCRRSKPGRGHKMLNVFFLVDTGSPCSYLCKEAMDALIGKDLQFQPSQLPIVLQTEGHCISMHLSPLITPDGKPGKFHEVNVLGMDFLKVYGLSLIVDTPIAKFMLLKKEYSSMEGDYEEEF